jgi:hypothetical protein
MGERERTWMILSCIWKFIEERHTAISLAILSSSIYPLAAVCTVAVAGGRIPSQ